MGVRLTQPREPAGIPPIVVNDITYTDPEVKTEQIYRYMSPHEDGRDHD
jgi:hypothetical protein